MCRMIIRSSHRSLHTAPEAGPRMPTYEEGAGSTSPRQRPLGTAARGHRGVAWRSQPVRPSGMSSPVPYVEYRSLNQGSAEFE